MSIYTCICGQKYDLEEDGEYQCVKCGKTFRIPMVEESKVCPFCQAEVPANALKCSHCGEWLEKNPEPPKSKGTYLILALLLGNWGAAEFYLGNTGFGICLLFLNIFVLLFTNGNLPAIGVIWLIYFIYACCNDIESSNQKQ